MSLATLPPTPAALAKAQKYIAEKRVEVGANNARTTQMYEAMFGSITQTLGEFGVKSLQIGDTHIPLSPSEASNHTVEARWLQALNEGKFVGALQVGNYATGYFDNEKVRIDKRKLDELVDVGLIRQVAPGAVIYGPKQATPWAYRIFDGYSIWTDDRAEFDALWASMKNWAKTQWHDDTLKNSKYPRKAEDVFSCFAYYDFAPDLSWRKAQHQRAEQHLAQAQMMGQWDALGQAEIKKMIRSLLQLEPHPLWGGMVPAWLDQLAPMLAHSMEGKSRHKRLQAEENKTRIHLSEGVNVMSVHWMNWSPVCPVPSKTIEAALPSTGKPPRARR